jgi:hypothetical protein
MPNIPFEKQVFPVDPVGQIEHKIAQGEPVSGDELLDAIEYSHDHPLVDRLRDIIRRFSVSAVKRRGRPSNCKGREDFALKEVDARYPALLRKHDEEARQRRLLAAAKGDVLPTAEPTPSELAYTEILNLKHMKRLFPSHEWETLRNKHCQWNNGHFHLVENDTDSEDYEAELDRRFPSVPES